MNSGKGGRSVSIWMSAELESMLDVLMRVGDARSRSAAIAAAVEHAIRCPDA